MRFGSLFAGIGGFDLGLERAGMTCQWQVEIEDYPTKILEKHWPEVHRERDIKECSGSNLEDVDLICGGFPCQDISVAGLGAGLAGERSGLWHEMHRIIGDIKPRWVIVENVAALLSRGMDVVLRDLSTIGYDCEWHIISASAVGAPHRRERVWIIANTSGIGRTEERQRKFSTGSATGTEIQLPNKRTRQRKAQGEITNANGKRFEGKRTENNPPGRSNKNGSFGICNGEELRRYASWWEAEPSVGRVAHGIPRRVDRLKGLGNAVVPQVVELIGRRIMEIDGNIN
ncbi:MAG: DNA cytosine methyltransferase [Planctomycetaceae bacterium]|nr:DNA cytosine methyltransferase [Planctomycetaceae bacterium]